MTNQIDIPANGGVIQVLVGDYRYFFVRTAANEFRVSFDGNTWETFKQNDQTEPRRKRDKIYFKALNGVAVTVTFDVGDSKFTAQDTAVTSTALANVANDLTKCVEAVPAQFLKTGAIGARTAFAAVALYFRWAIVMAYKDKAGTVNVGNVQIGVSNALNEQPITLAPGDQYVLPIPTGAKVNFQNWFLSIANAGDGVVVLYF